MSEARTSDQVCTIDDPDADHDWELSEYDPSVGMMTNSRTCIVCGRTEFIDHSGEPDDVT